MGHFASTNKPLKTKKQAEEAGNKSNEVTLAPTQLDFAEYVSGSVIADQAGALYIEESFDYPANHENDELALSGSHWTLIEKIVVASSTEGQSFRVFPSGPYFRLRFVNTAETEQKIFRLYVRAQEKGKI